MRPVSVLVIFVPYAAESFRRAECLDTVAEEIRKALR